jgi:transcriptional regulator with XRE-family HTH domain
MPTRRFLVRTGADLGRTIAEARLERGLTQAQLARRARIDRTYLARLEAGHTVQQVDRALDLLRVLGIELLATMGEDTSASNSVGPEQGEGA